MLAIINSKIGDTTERVKPDWQPLANLQNLRDLSLYGYGVTDECLPVITRLKSLERLDLSGADIGDAEFDTLKMLPHLQSLSVQETKITADAITKLSELKSLEDLVLSDNDMEDASFDTLKSLPHLQYLNLQGSYMTAKAIRELSELKQLNLLILGSGLLSYQQSWTSEQISRLQEALPDTTIFVDGERVER